jgi:hypothetical protein
MLDDVLRNLLGAESHLDLQLWHRTEASLHTSQGTEWGM